jgi:uncharacterized circularly permuted ATP-grasp superfamily protein
MVMSTDAVAFDEMVKNAAENIAQSINQLDGVRPHYQIIANWLKEQQHSTLRARNEEAELLFRRVGITLAVYGNTDGTERTIPFDILPRIFTSQEWQHIKSGVQQRIRALNMFLHDVYHDQRIIQDKIIPAEQILNNAQYRPHMMGVNWLKAVTWW